jgi:hypothetical protein
MPIPVPITQDIPGTITSMLQPIIITAVTATIMVQGILAIQ